MTDERSIYEETFNDIMREHADGVEVEETYLHRPLWQQLRDEMISRGLAVGEASVEVLGVKVVPVDLPEWVKA